MELKLPIPVTKEGKFLVILQLLSAIPPFSKLRPRELEVFAELLKINEKYKDLPEKERNKLIFDYDTKQEIADKCNIRMNNIYNILQGLKKKGLILGSETKDYINPGYTLSDLESITFILKNDNKEWITYIQ